MSRAPSPSAKWSRVFDHLSAEHAGFLTTSYGRVGNMEERLVVGEGQQMHAMTMRLAPQGVIAGKVLNEAGEPVERARVAILKPTYSQGKLRMVQGDFHPDRRSGRIPRPEHGGWKVPGGGEVRPAGNFEFPAAAGGTRHGV